MNKLTGFVGVLLVCLASMGVIISGFIAATMIRAGQHGVFPMLGIVVGCIVGMSWGLVVIAIASIAKQQTVK
jgi:hypothetical protein